MEFEEVRFGMLMMVLCDREGRVYDVWICFGSMHVIAAKAVAFKEAMTEEFKNYARQVVLNAQAMAEEFFKARL